MSDMAYNYFPVNYQPYNPYQFQQAQPAQQVQAPPSLLWVRNSQEAAMYPVAPNNAVALWDSGAPVIYLKKADAAGKPSMQTFDLVERIEQPVESVSPAEVKDAYATKNELAALASVVKSVEDKVSRLTKEEEDDG